MNSKHRNRATAIAVAVSLAFSLGLWQPSQAASRYEFAYGGGAQARMWISSQWNPGTCTIDSDYYLTQQAPQVNQVDSVVLSPSRLGLSGRVVSLSWGATFVPPNGAQLKVRFVRTGGSNPPGCPRDDLTLGGPGTYAIAMPTNASFMVVTATEGTAQVWFTV